MYLCINCPGKDSQAGNIVFPWEGVYPVGVGARRVSVDWCCIPAQPKLSGFRQPPFYPAHISMSWLDWRGLLHMVMSECPEAKEQAQYTHTFRPLLARCLLTPLRPKQFTLSSPNPSWRNTLRFLMGGATNYSARWF